jgi:putative membrane protein
MKKLLSNLLLSALFISMVACSENNQKQTQNNDPEKEAKEENEEKFDNTNLEDDSKYMVGAAEGGMMEVKLSELALANSSSAKIKELAKHMVKDHSAANTELKALAAKKNVTLPTELGEKCTKTYNDLASKIGADFDKEYASIMVKDHKNAIEDFKKEVENGKDSEVKAWANGKLPTLEHHLSMAESTKEAVKQ